MGGGGTVSSKRQPAFRVFFALFVCCVHNAVCIGASIQVQRRGCASSAQRRPCEERASDPRETESDQKSKHHAHYAASTHPAAARTPSNHTIACADGGPYFDYKFINRQAPASVLAALREGRWTQAVEAFTPDDDHGPTKIMSSINVALECMRVLAPEVSGKLVLLLPSLAAVAEASTMAAEWPVEEHDRLEITTLLHRGGPDDTVLAEGSEQPEPIGAVVLCEISFEDGLSRGGVENQLLRDARAWLRLGGAAALCVNARVPMLRFESDLVTHSFSLLPYAIRRELLRYNALRTVGGFLSERICARKLAGVS